MSHILLQTSRLILRPFAADDADDLFALNNDPQVMRYINGGEPTPMAVIREQMLPAFMRYAADLPGMGVWAAEERASGRFVGWFSFRPSGAQEGEVILGYRLQRWSWGSGYATEGTRALIARGFSEWGVERVVATTYQDNVASMRVLEKSGLRFVRDFRLNEADLGHSDTSYTTTDELWDGVDVEYALTRSDWLLLAKGTDGLPEQWESGSSWHKNH